MINITILYDNDTRDQRLQADWGFAALIEACGRTILFDTGAHPEVLLHNMQALNISPGGIEEIFISHDHWDHTGGLSAILAQQPVRVYVPDTMDEVPAAPETVAISGPAEIHPQVYSTGTLKNIEQAMCIQQNGAVIVIVGCSHPGIQTILEGASDFGRVSALIGGFHGFSNFSVLDSLDLVCATHCTQHKAEIRDRFPEITIAGGAGTVIQI